MYVSFAVCRLQRRCDSEPSQSFRPTRNELCRRALRHQRGPANRIIAADFDCRSAEHQHRPGVSTPSLFAENAASRSGGLVTSQLSVSAGLPSSRFTCPSRSGIARTSSPIAIRADTYPSHRSLGRVTVIDCVQHIAERGHDHASEPL